MSLSIYAFITSVLVVYCYLYRDNLVLNEKSLHKQWLFWLAIIFPLISSFYFMLWLGSSYPFRWDAVGYNTFLEINKFSLGILTLSPILGAFVVSAHRSYQTDIQIKTAEKQLIEAQKKNKVDIFQSKKKSIYEQLGYIYDIEQKKIKQLLTIYNKAYIISNEYDDTLNKNFTIELNTKINNLLFSLKDFLTINKQDIFYNKKVLDPTRYISFIMGVRLKIDSLSNNYSDIKKYLTFEINEPLTSIVDNLAKSSQKYKEPSILYTILLAEILRKTYDIINVTTEVFTALYPGKDINTYITYLSDLNNIKDNIEAEIEKERRFFLTDGDEVATENQNNHE